MVTLVTGATGFVGSAVMRRLVGAGHDVRVLTRPGSNRRNLDGFDVDIREGDLTDAASVERALAGCRYLFHVAADYRLWTPRPDELYRTNVDATVNLMQVAQATGVERIVYTSSVATLGRRADGLPANENTPSRLEDMHGHYKRSKFLAEQAVTRLIADAGLPAVIVNPSTPVGPGDIRPTPTGRIIRNALRGRLPAYVDTGLNIVHVEDVAEGHWLAFEKGVVGERYILGGENISLQQLLYRIADLCGRRYRPFRLPMPAAYAAAAISELLARVSGKEPLATIESVRMTRPPMYFSSAKADQCLGYQSRPAQQAIADAVTWFSHYDSCPPRQ